MRKTSLTDLPQELLVLILSECSTLNAVVSLSSVNRQLRGAWTQNVQQIASSVLGRQMVDFDEANALARLQTSYELSSKDPPKTQSNLWLRTILDNVIVASQLQQEWFRMHDFFPERTGSKYTSVHKAYYQLVQLILLARHECSCSVLEERVDLLPDDELQTLDAFYSFLGGWPAFGSAEYLLMMDKERHSESLFASDPQSSAGSKQNAWHLARLVISQARKKSGGRLVTQAAV